MEYRKLGNTDLNLSVITYGSFAIGGTMWAGTGKKEAQEAITASQLVLRWTTLQPGITAVLAGARNKEQAISNAQAAHIGLSKEELSFINDQLAK